jgi:hypothetical protein
MEAGLLLSCSADIALELLALTIALFLVVYFELYHRKE